MPEEQLKNANKPVSTEGRTYHVETRAGEVANRIVTVGDMQRARSLATHLDKVLFEKESHRGFLTITGTYRGVPLSIVAIGMGPAMVDFFVRETRMVVQGPLAIVRFGSCGSICPATIGDVIVADSAFGIGRNYAYFSEERTESDRPYMLWPAVGGDVKLTASVAAALGKALGESHVYRGQVGNADSFYCSQGRIGTDFYDANDTLIERVQSKHPRAVALEMESHTLFHLARVSTGPQNTQPPSVRAACALMVFVDRTGNAIIGPDTSKVMVRTAARAVFDALVDDMPTQDGLHPATGSVWEGELAI
ncbi:hypothetical protein GGF46_005213 [Coemansia sp. RSA 552]|nr:hypothetical protein GGF46_005213 [Coemansia sp. RSA 552]